MANLENPVDYLQSEHHLLRDAVDITNKLLANKDDVFFHKQMHDLIIFFRNYGEIYHFPKEEYILYPILRGRSNLLPPNYVHDILDNHDDFKALIADMEHCYELNDCELLRRVTKDYLNELVHHLSEEEARIFKEALKLLSDVEQKRIVSEFIALDEKHGDKIQLIESLYKINAQL